MFDKLKGGIKSVVKKVKTKELSDKELTPLVSDLEVVLTKNGVAVKTAESIGSRLKEELMHIEHQRFKSARPMVEHALRNSVQKLLEEPIKKSSIEIDSKIKDAREEGRAFVICILGINGTGKTTTIAKLGNLFQNQGYSVVLAASDTFRAGSIQQLGKHADKLGIKMISSDYGGDPASVAVDAIDHAESKQKDIVIIDMAGRMQNNVNLVRELKKIIRNTEPDLKIFVGDSLAGNDVILQAKQFDEDIGIDGIIMTKLDSDSKGGAILSVAHITQKPILFVGVGQGYNDLQVFKPELIVDELLSF